MRELLMTLLLLAICFPLQAGKETHGGAAMVCPGSVEILDFWEGSASPVIEGRGLNILPSADVTGTPDEQQKIYEERALSKLFQISPFFHDQVKKALIKMHKVKEMLPSEFGGRIPDDTGRVLWPDDCELVWAALYKERFRGDKLWIAEDVWDQLDPFNRAGLMLHEAVYYVERNSSDEISSERTRAVVAALFSDLKLTRLNDSVPKGAEICVSLPKKGKATMYWRVEEGEKVRRQFAMVAGHYVLTKSFFEVENSWLQPETEFPMDMMATYEMETQLTGFVEETGEFGFAMGPLTAFGKMEVEVFESKDFLLNSCGSLQRNRDVYFKFIDILKNGKGN